MAFIHKTTMTPGKLELLASWLPTQPWYVRTPGGPDLGRAGGFRLDDPQGEVGMEFMVVSDGSGDRPILYHVPLTYRGAPLDGADHALVGTSEHGVLGRRWVYDGVHDPVLVDQLLALLRGRAVPQAQSVSDTPDPSVVVRTVGAPFSIEVTSSAVVNGADGTELVVEGGAAEGSEGTEGAGGAGNGRDRRLLVEVVRRPLPVRQATPAEAAADVAGVLGEVVAGWTLPDGREGRGRFFALREGSS